MADPEVDAEISAAKDYQSMALRQVETVRQIEDELTESPSDDLRAKHERETELLHHYINAAKGDLKNRAKRAAEVAKKSILKKAIV